MIFIAAVAGYWIVFLILHPWIALWVLLGVIAVTVLYGIWDEMT